MYWFIFIGNNILLEQEGSEFRIPQGDMPPTPTFEWTTMQKLPDFNGKSCCAYALTTPPKDGFSTSLTTMDLRASYHVLPFPLYNIAGKAFELLYWDSNTRYCGHCGAPMKRHTDISKRCTNGGKEVWPQVAPAIIVRIRKQPQIDANGQPLETEKILLVHARNFRRKNYFGLVAGFVETGESLEECVRREVMEEHHLQIKNICYFASQPWPYPCGIMIGFTADYASGELKLQDEELSQGGWFDAQNLPPIPDKMSIARRLIDDWIGNFRNK